MENFLITFRSVTPAQRGEGVLRRAGISCSIQRTPRVLADRGCGYSIAIKGAQLPAAVEQLRQKGIAYQKTYALGACGPEEVQL